MTDKNPFDFLCYHWYSDIMKPSELVKWRGKRGLTQTQLGELLSVTATTIYRWEKGLRSIPAFLPLALESLDRKEVTKKEVRKSNERRK